MNTLENCLRLVLCSLISLFCSHICYSWSYFVSFYFLLNYFFVLIHHSVPEIWVNSKCKSSHNEKNEIHWLCKFFTVLFLRCFALWVLPELWYWWINSHLHMYKTQQNHNKKHFKKNLEKEISKKKI